MPEILSAHLLSWVIFLPLVGALILLLMPRPADEPDSHHGHGHEDDAQPVKSSSAANMVRGFTVFWSLLTFAISLCLFCNFEAAKSGFQLVEGPTAWIEAYNINYHIGIDGTSLLLILLTTFLTVLCAVYSWNVKSRIKEYMVFLLVLETAMTGVFCALDLVLFYIFWEAVLIPMYFLIGIWGHERRIYAAVKFFLFTFAGSVLMLVGILYIYAKCHSFNLAMLLDPTSKAHISLMGLDPRAALMVYWTFALAFMIKVPMFPFHTWLPDAHVEAPTSGSVILAGVMLKMGTYGFLRFCLPLFPGPAHDTAPIFVTLAVIGIVYGAVVATVQPDMKKLVAYSSVSHLGFVMLGIFTFTPLGVTGAILQSVNHGISTGMLFFMVGMMYDRRHTREIVAFGGIKRVLPVLSTFFLIGLLSSVALPLTNGFVGEFLILQGGFSSAYVGQAWTAVAATGMVLSAVYMLWLFQRVFAGSVTHKVNLNLKDLDWREKIVLVPLVVIIFWMGCYVSSFSRYLSAPVALMLKQTSQIQSVTSEHKGSLIDRNAIAMAKGMERDAH